jgi:hypothetical protein
MAAGGIVDMPGVGASLVVLLLKLLFRDKGGVDEAGEGVLALLATVGVADTERVGVEVTGGEVGFDGIVKKSKSDEETAEDG